MKTLFIDKTINYSGTQLAAHWIYKNFNIAGDALVAFCGEARVDLEHMVDIEDVLKNEPIYSKNMLNFIIEHFEISLSEAVLRQRLLMCIIKEILEECGLIIERKGDDLFHEGRKLSVSIATKSLTSCLIHTGINICADGAPIEVSSLEQMKITDVKTFAQGVMQKYLNEITDIKTAVSKVRGVVL